jgi:hypothetical protein
MFLLSYQVSNPGRSVGSQSLYRRGDEFLIASFLALPAGCHLNVALSLLRKEDVDGNSQRGSAKFSYPKDQTAQLVSDRHRIVM